jgi:cardiolipin synthase
MTLDLLINIGYLIFIIYVIGVAVFIISENRTPQSTFAWLLVLIAFPLVGLLPYIFLGRGSHAFS